MLKPIFLENNASDKKPLALFDISTNLASYSGVWMIIGENICNFRFRMGGKEIYAAKNQKGYLQFLDLEYEHNRNRNRINSPYLHYIAEYLKYA